MTYLNLICKRDLLLVFFFLVLADEIPRLQASTKLSDTHQIKNVNHDFKVIISLQLLLSLTLFSFTSI